MVLHEHFIKFYLPTITSTECDKWFRPTKHTVGGETITKEGENKPKNKNSGTSIGRVKQLHPFFVSTGLIVKQLLVLRALVVGLSVLAFIYLLFHGKIWGMRLSYILSSNLSWQKGRLKLQPALTMTVSVVLLLGGCHGNKKKTTNWRTLLKYSRIHSLRAYCFVEEMNKTKIFECGE